MWPPRRAGSRGETTSTPSGTSSASTISSANAVSATDFARTAAMPASSSISSPDSSGTIARIGGVPLTTPRTPAAGV